MGQRCHLQCHIVTHGSIPKSDTLLLCGFLRRETRDLVVMELYVWCILLGPAKVGESFLCMPTCMPTPYASKKFKGQVHAEGEGVGMNPK